MTARFAGTTVFVTGADGFIGSHLVELLVAQGATVRALVYYNSWSADGWLADVATDIRRAVEILPGDVRDAERMRQLVKGCDYVFHLASLIAIPYSYEAPRSYVDTNVGGTINILEACRASDSLTCLIHASTSEVYGTARQVPIPETHPLIGQSPYSASKIAADKMVESYHLSFGLPVVTARPFNTYGPRQTARAVIPTIASQLVAGVDRLQLGAMTPTRDFNFCTDTAQGLVALAACDAAIGQTINIGSGEEWSIAQTVEMLCDIVGRKVEVVMDENRLRPAASEVNRLVCDNRRITELTSWRSTVSFREGLSRTVVWVERNIDRFVATAYAR